MTDGEKLYLLLVVGAMAVFAAVLAYYSWQHGQQAHRTPRAARPAPDAPEHLPEHRQAA